MNLGGIHTLLVNDADLRDSYVPQLRQVLATNGQGIQFDVYVAECLECVTNKLLNRFKDQERWDVIVLPNGLFKKTRWLWRQYATLVFVVDCGEGGGREEECECYCAGALWWPQSGREIRDLAKLICKRVNADCRIRTVHDFAVQHFMPRYDEQLRQEYLDQYIAVEIDVENRDGKVTVHEPELVKFWMLVSDRYGEDWAEKVYCEHISPVRSPFFVG